MQALNLAHRYAEFRPRVCGIVRPGSYCMDHLNELEISGLNMTDLGARDAQSSLQKRETLALGWFPCGEQGTRSFQRSAGTPAARLLAVLLGVVTS